MPERDIRPYLSHVTLERLAALKQTWKVSMQALLARSGNLGLLTENQQRYLWMKLSAAGWRTREPVDIDREEPALLTEMVKFHLGDLGYSEEQLCSLLHVLSPELRDTFGVGPGAAGLRVIK